MTEIKLTWQDREQSRFDDGTYKPLPLILDITWIAEHYAHLSVKGEPDMIAFTPTADKGETDRQTSMKFGRYLKQYYDLDDIKVHVAVVAFRLALAIPADEPIVLKLAGDRETINRIFETEMSACGAGNYKSCMHGKFTTWEVRPYHVYANSPDVAVAYLENGDSIFARAVVSTKTKKWVRLYSTQGCETKCAQLEGLLKSAGYAHGDLEGSRLTKLPKRNRHEVLPYLDGDAQNVEENGSYWDVVDRHGDYECTNTDGTGDPIGGNRCSSCEEREENCECYMCECCGDRSRDGCEDCSMCEVCDGCTLHDGCSCDRCSECHEIINPRRRYVTACGCDRCSDCGDLMDDCECPEPEPEPIAKTFIMVRDIDNGYQRLPVLASVRFANHTFLVHKDKDFRSNRLYKVSYAPLGLSGGEGSTIQEAIDRLVSYDVDFISGVVDRSVNSAWETNMPMLSSETGIQIYA